MADSYRRDARWRLCGGVLVVLVKRRVAKYRRDWMTLPRFSVDEQQQRRWWEPRRWRTVATFDTLGEAVKCLRGLELAERNRRDAFVGQIEVLFEAKSAPEET